MARITNTCSKVSVPLDNETRRVDCRPPVIDVEVPGHEDLRQDERVMQLFGLVNTLLQVDPETFKRHLSIRRYAVIPLSPNSGLIGWVPHTDTLHTLIRDYRESKKILLSIEHRLMLQMAPAYDNLTLLQKVEVFEYALENTTGQDLYRVLWLKSRNSEVSSFVMAHC